MFTFGPNSFNMNAKYMIKPFFFHFRNIWLRSQTATLTPFGNTVQRGVEQKCSFTFLHPLKPSRTIVHGSNYGAAGSAVRGAKFVFCLSSHFRVFSRHFATWLVGFPVIGVQWHYDFSSSLPSYTTVLMLGHTVCWAEFK